MKTSMRQFVAATAAAAVATAGTLALTGPVDAAAPTDQTVAAKTLAAKAKKAKYAMGGHAYGTEIQGGQLGASSGRTAYSYLYCNTGTKTRNTALVGADVLPGIASLVKVGVLETDVKARKGPKAARKAGFPKGTQAATVSTSSVANVSLLGLEISALDTEARAWVDKNGKFHTKERYGNAKIQANTGTPLDDLLNGLPLNTLVDLLLGNIVKDTLVNTIVNGVLKVANLGEITMGKERSKVNKKGATSAAKALQVRLYVNGKKGDADDIVVNLGGTRAAVKKGAENGRFGGRAFGLKADVLNGAVSTSRVADLPIPCLGTGGEWVNTGVLNLDLLQAGLVKVDGVATKVRTTGKNKKKKRTATAQTETARVEVGGPNGLVISAIKAQAKAIRKPGGKLQRKFSSSLGDISIAGNSFSLEQLLDPALTAVGGLLNTLGIGKVEINKTRKNANGGGITALRIELLDGNLAAVEVGSAEAKIRK